jgi:hypothetical protein
LKENLIFNIMKKKLIPVLFFLCIMSAQAQVYSKYYFLDTLKDKGLTSEMHSKYKNKFFFEQEHSTIKTGTIADADKNILEFNKNHNINANFYLDRSLRYYFAKYQNDKNLKFEDWNYGPWKGNYFNNAGKNTARYVGCLLFVMIVDGDTACTWKSSLFEKNFEEKTDFNFDLWESTNNNKNMGDENEFWPLFSYVKMKKKAGLLNVKIDVYAGKLVCKSIHDRGPDILASGTIKFNVSQSDLDYLDGLSNKSWKLKFKDYDLENELLWGVKQ